MTAPAALGIIGAGAWGTALGAMLVEGGTSLVWARDPAIAAQINGEHRNTAYLPGVVLPPSLAATEHLSDIALLPVVLAAVPAQHLGAVLAALPPATQINDLILCAKGIEAGSGRLMAEVARAQFPTATQIAVLSGPTFAAEVARRLPTAATLACGGGAAQWERLAPLLSRPAFRLYYSDDVVGTEIGGAVKNVLAIACGVVAGLGLGENARAALIARGHAELTRFGVAKGARAETLAGLAGLGDLILTAASPASRNFALGRALGEGQSAAAALHGKRSVAEGAATAPVLAGLARAAGVDMPIVDAVVAILAGAAPGTIVAQLLARPLRAEADAA